MLINLPIHNFKILAKRPVLDRLGPVKTKTGLKTEKDRSLQSFQSFSVLGRRQTSLGLGPSPKGQKTGPDLTFKH